MKGNPYRRVSGARPPRRPKGAFDTAPVSEDEMTLLQQALSPITLKALIQRRKRSYGEKQH